MARYRPGVSVLVLYKPSDPKVAVLEPRLPKGRVFGLLFTALLAIGSGILLMLLPFRPLIERAFTTAR